MRRLWTLTRMALHELWISFRLIPLIGLPIVGGMLVSAVPPEFAGETAVGGASFWYAVAAGVAICVASGLAALTMAHERRRGTVAWMAVRAVPRSSVLFSWFLAFAHPAHRRPGARVGRCLAGRHRSRGEHRPTRSPSPRPSRRPPPPPWPAWPPAS